MIARFKAFWANWKWEIGSTAIGFLLLIAFWLWWVFGLGMDSPIMPSHVVFIFLAMFKVAVFNALAWALAILSMKGEAEPGITWRTWAVLMFCLSLSALG